MSKTQKYYVVWVGNRPGIYESWADCQSQVKGFPNARYKAFKSKGEAEEAFGKAYQSEVKKKPKRSLDARKIVSNSISVDAACSGNPGVMEYRGVKTLSKEELFRQGPFHYGTNNIGEFLAIVHGLAYLKKLNNESTAIYTDSRTALAWIRKKRINTKIDLAKKNPKLKVLVTRAEKWLENHTYKTKIIKWETKDWGEIPADFGRK